MMAVPSGFHLTGLAGAESGKSLWGYFYPSHQKRKQLIGLNQREDTRQPNGDGVSRAAGAKFINQPFRRRLDAGLGVCVKARYLDFKNTDSGAGLYVEMSETKVKFTATDGAEASGAMFNLTQVVIASPPAAC